MRILRAKLLEAVLSLCPGALRRHLESIVRDPTSTKDQILDALVRYGQGGNELSERRAVAVRLITAVEAGDFER